MGSARPLALALLVTACAHQTVHPNHADGILHHVHSGETLWRISRTYDVPLQALLTENELRDPSHLSEGTLLFIPGVARELPVPPVEAPKPGRRANPTAIPRAGQRPLDPAAHGEPMSWPAPGVIISGFGSRERDVHEGIDLACPEGTPVRAAEDGVVLFAGEQRGYGNLVLLAHDRDLVTVYAHNAQNLVEKGDKVTRGEEIARVGRTGNATGPHLHFEVRLATRPRDPLGFLR